MAYKSLNDRNRQKALPQFLAAADLLTGIVCTIAIDKRYRWVASSPNALNVLNELGTLEGRWGIPAFEAMSRIVLIWSAILGCVSKPGQDITWITDEDEIAANDDRLTDLLNWAGRVSHHFCKGPMGTLAVNTTALDSDDRGFEDFVAIPDVCAGAIAELANSWTRHSDKRTDGQPKYVWNSPIEKASYLTDWYFAQTGTLRRVAIVITREPDGQLMVQRILPELDRGS